MSKQLRVAIVHDYIKEYGGAERVLEALHELYPFAPVFTTVYLPKYLGPHKDRFKQWDIRTSWFQHMPGKAKLISPLRLLAPFLLQQFSFSAFDVVIVSATGAYTPNMINKKTAVHICYCHTPPRYLYGYATARDWKRNPFFRIGAAIGNHILRMVDYNSAQRVDYFIANSEHVKARIKKFYRKDAVVIYPPVDVQTTQHNGQYSKKSGRQGYYLTGGRLARPKHIDIIVKACVELGVPLKVFGKGFAGYGEELERLAADAWRVVEGKKIPLVEFLGEVTDGEKQVLMSNATAFLMAAEEEDFGITPVEAMGVGTPVIAYASGGVVESIRDRETGLLYKELSVNCLKKALKEFEAITIDPATCVTQAEKFKTERFKKEIHAFIKLHV